MLTVYTAITGGYEPLQEPQCPADPLGRPVAFVAFAPVPLGGGSSRWMYRPPVWEHDDPRRTARWHKLHPHRLFPEARFTLWHDGCHALKVNPWALVDTYLVDPRHPHAAPVCDYTGDADFATFKHPQRTTVAQELMACAQLKKDNIKLMQSQVQRYRDQGFPDTLGLYETSAVLRRRTEDVAALGEAWWAEIVRGSVRDQLSLPYVLWRNPMRMAALPGCRDKNEFFTYVSHKH